jgi:hypothetical protein
MCAGLIAGRSLLWNGLLTLLKSGHASIAPPLEISAPQQLPAADQDKGVLSALKRIPDLLRPDPPAPTGDTPRPPMPIGPASP